MSLSVNLLIFAAVIGVQIFANETPLTTEQAEVPGACKTHFCGSGRDCMLDRYGNPTCTCAKKCRSRDHLVCGSDGHVYPNHCELHRAACITDMIIFVKNDGPCEDEKAVKEKDTEPRKPLVCYQIERDELRQLLIDWLKLNVEEDGWISRGKKYTEVVGEKFRECDENSDEVLEADEFLKCTEKNDTINKLYSREDGNVRRGLCVDSLISLADDDGDWKLTLDEFTKCMDPGHEAPKRQCSLEDQTYEDGAETKVNCKTCICACGNWVCTGTSCDKSADRIIQTERPGHIPSIDIREEVLSGFLAADEVNLKQVEREVKHSSRTGHTEKVNHKATHRKHHHTHHHGKHHHSNHQGQQKDQSSQ